MSDLICEDQAGFLPSRPLKDNVRNIINIIEYLEVHNEKQAALIFLDTEKAFDNVSWIFMKRVLKKMDLGKIFLKAIEAIYTEQRANIIVNKTISDGYTVMKGTRQGCPLSPLLFILISEVLAQR